MTRQQPRVALLILALAFGCGDDETKIVDGPAGAAGQVGVGGSSSAGTGGGGSAGDAGSAGTAGGGGSSNQPSVCQAPSDPFAWPAPGSADVPADAAWKADLEVPTDAFFSLPQGGQEDVRWVKFIVLASDPSRIYFHDATSYPFHYEFASEHIPRSRA